MKNTHVDLVICPGCTKSYTRQEILDMYLAVPKNRRHFVCLQCDYECNTHPYRPFTIREILSGRTDESLWNSVSLVKYLQSVLKVVKTSNVPQI